MMHWILSYLLNSAIAQFGIAGLVLAGSVLLWFEARLPITRHIATGTAVGSAVFLFVGVWLYNEGVRHVKAEWQAAEEAARMEAKAAREDAEKSVADDIKRKPSKRMRHDRYDRDAK